MPEIKEHPVWEVYDLQRNCRLNIKYWTKRLARYRKWNFLMEYSMFVTAPGSAVAGFFFWQAAFGKFVWGILAFLTALLGAAKPLLKLSERIETLQKVVIGYRGIEFQLEALGTDIRREDCYSNDKVSAFKRLQSQIQEITKDEPLEEVDEALRREYFEAVKQELPEAAFHIPTK
jgi:hypothetical protein